jgi:hypothetical protein
MRLVALIGLAVLAGITDAKAQTYPIRAATITPIFASDSVGARDRRSASGRPPEGGPLSESPTIGSRGARRRGTEARGRGRKSIVTDLR